MLVLTLRTDKPEAELGLFDAGKKVAYHSWPAHRELSNTIHTKLAQLLKAQHKELSSIEGIVAYQGPGSFTGLRIGLSVANALAYSLDIPILASGGDRWIQKGIQKLAKGQSDPLALPNYGAPVHITQQKK